MIAPRFPDSSGFRSGRDGETELLMIVLRFELRWWHVTDGLEQSAIVEPIHPFEGGVFHSIQRAPRTACVDDLGLELQDFRC